ncbi:MAG: ribosome recycling factor, partial [Coriobacteriia bacterium]|nr:ribosome recycling factor [Coriobacteriia bacterium]
MTKDIIKETDQHMDKTVSALQHEFAAIRTGRASGQILEKVMVEYYGTPTPLLQLASIKVPE